MPSREDIYYFGAGPASLPTSVLERASKALLNYDDLGIGLTEMSHRSPQANQILNDSSSTLRRLLSIPDSHEILYLQGGGSGQFSAVVYHMVGVWVEKQRCILEETEKLSEDEVIQRLRIIIKDRLRLDYIVTGSWSLKASQEASRLLGAEHVNVAVDARKAKKAPKTGSKFGVIPSETSWQLTQQQTHNNVDGPALVYYCDNETVDGVEFPSFPQCLSSSPVVVADMSSNILSRSVDVSKYAAIFAGMQKNIGNTGVTVLIVKKSILPPQSSLASSSLLRQLGLTIGPVVLDWPTIAKNNSLYNTLPIFDVWVASQVMYDLENFHKEKRVSGQEEVSGRKAASIYDVLDNYPRIYSVVPHKNARSRMNICFRIKGGDEVQEKDFLKAAEERGLMGLKGHRSVGGIRASNCMFPVIWYSSTIYLLIQSIDNATSEASVDRLVKFLEEYAEAS